MQAANVGWVGQTFALGRYSNCSQEKRFQNFGVVRCRGGGGGGGGGSQEKKPRRRKTKEERREMVESFIIKYRNSNNGKFPSLNLTHKEVGGSYYIVREILRDIIQENRVLGPGSMNSKALSFDDCPDPQESPITHEIDDDNIEILHSSDQDEDGENCGSATSKTQEMFLLQQNVLCVQQVLNSSSILEAGFLKNNLVQNGNPADTTYLETSLGKQNGVPCDNSSMHELDSSDQPLPLVDTISNLDKDMVRNGHGFEERTNNVDDEANFSPETSNTSQTNGTFALQQHLIFSGTAASSTVDQVIEEGQSTGSLAASTTETYDSNMSSLETKRSSDSHEELEVQESIDNFELLSLPLVQDSLTERLESVDISSTSADEEFEKMMPFVSTCLASPQTLDTKECVGSRHKEMENIIEGDKGQFEKSISATLKEEHVFSNAKHEHIVNNSTGINSPCREKSEKAQEKKAINPFWASIRVFIDAVVKFWTE